MNNIMKVEIKESIALLSIDDGKANAMNFAFFDEFNASLDSIEKSEAGALIIQGRGGFFSAGLDLKLMPSLNPEELNNLVTRFAETVLRVFGFPLPTIAACTGHTIAGGAILALACDRRYFLEGNFRFQLNETLIGIPFPTWMLLISRASIPVQYQTSAVLHGQAYFPGQAHERGIADGTIPPGEDPAEYCRVMAKDFLGFNKRAYAITKKRLREKDIKNSLKLLKDELKE